MKIEVLFPEICNLYGELGNISYLQKSCADIEVVETGLNDEPIFVSEVPDLIYMGTMTEKSQLLVIEKLNCCKERIVELIEDGANFLVTGNALEVFGKEIKDVDGVTAEGLGIFDITTSRDMMNRYNSLYLGEFSDGLQPDAGMMKIEGFKSQFTHSYWEDGAVQTPLFITERGPGLNPQIKGEGIRVNNFMATYVIGPLLVLNPLLAKHILRMCGAKKIDVAFEEAAMESYEARVREYSNPDTGFYY